MNTVKIELTVNVDEYFEEVLSRVESDSRKEAFRREYAMDNYIKEDIISTIQKDLQCLVDDIGAIHDYGNYFEEMVADVSG